MLALGAGMLGAGARYRAARRDAAPEQEKSSRRVVPALRYAKRDVGTLYGDVQGWTAVRGFAAIGKTDRSALRGAEPYDLLGQVTLVGEEAVAAAGAMSTRSVLEEAPG